MGKGRDEEGERKRKGNPLGAIKLDKWNLNKRTVDPDELAAQGWITNLDAVLPLLGYCKLPSFWTDFIHFA